MIVLSLFDGCGTAYQALKNLNIKTTKYYASEINESSIKICKKNHPDSIHLGDINNWETWDIEKPDIIIAGSPCQGFSVAGKQKNFLDYRSKLLYKFVDVLRYYRPRFFILENVKMKLEYQEFIDFMLDVKPLKINSNVFSAQNRKRLYWTNIPNISNISDITNIPVNSKTVKDIIHENVDGFIPVNYIVQDKDNLIETPKSKNKFGYFGKDSQANRIYRIDNKAITLCGDAGGGSAKMGMYKINDYIRKLTPVECERLQGLPDNYTKGVTNNQRYKMLGNGFTCQVIEHILKHI